MKNKLYFHVGQVTPFKIVTEFDSGSGTVRVVVREARSEWVVLVCKRAFYDTVWSTTTVGYYSTLSQACDIASAVELVLGAR